MNPAPADAAMPAPNQAAPPPDQAAAPSAPAQPKQISPFMGFLAQFRHEHASMPPEADKAAQALWDSMKSLYSEKGQMSANADNYSYDDFIHDVGVVLAGMKGSMPAETTATKKPAPKVTNAPTG